MISSVFMVGGALLAILMSIVGIGIEEQLLAGVILCLMTSWAARKLYAEEHLPSLHLDQD